MNDEVPTEGAEQELQAEHINSEKTAPDGTNATNRTSYPRQAKNRVIEQTPVVDENDFNDGAAAKSEFYKQQKKPLKLYKATKKTFQCKECDKQFKNRSHLTEHVRSHTGEKPFACDMCKKAFSTKSAMLTHRRTHTGEKPYKCSICGSCFTQASGLQIHGRMHSGEKPHVCEVCGKAFTTKQTLNDHMTIHTGERRYVCDICGKAFAVRCSLKEHRRIHSGEKPYTCDICGRPFAQLSNLTNHRRTHTGEKPYLCSTCGTSFAQRGSMLRHVNRIHVRLKAFSCETCGKAFSEKCNLVDHTRIHSGEKPYKCETCGQAYAHRSQFLLHKVSDKCNLVDHTRACSAKNVFTCDVCGETYSRQNELIQHKLLHPAEKTKRRNLDSVSHVSTQTDFTMPQSTLTKAVKTAVLLSQSSSSRLIDKEMQPCSDTNNIMPKINYYQQNKTSAPISHPDTMEHDYHTNQSKSCFPIPAPENAGKSLISVGVNYQHSPKLSDAIVASPGNNTGISESS